MIKKEMYLYSWSRDEFNYDIVITLDDSGRSIVRVQKCDKLLATNERIELLEKEFIKVVKKYIALCRGMKFKDAKDKIVGKKSFVEMCDAFGNALVDKATGGRR